MKLEFGMIVTQGSGKLGGHVFTKGRNGNNARTKVKPINRRTTAQVDQRGSLSSLSAAWRALTQAQRDAWTSAGLNYTHHNNFGQKFKPTGKNFYTEINLNLLTAGSATVASPPASTPAFEITALGFDAHTVPGTYTLTFAPTPVPAANTIEVSATRPLSQGVASPGSAYRKVTVLAAAVGSPFDLTAAYTAKFGAIPAGTKVFVRAKAIQSVTGQPGLPQQASDIGA